MADIAPRRKSVPRYSTAVEQARLLDLTLDGIFVRDAAGVLRYWNRGAVRLYQWSSSEALGHVSHELLRTRFPLPLAELEAQLLRDGIWEGELEHCRRDGSWITVTSRWSAQFDAQGKLAAILESNTDITKRKQAEHALRLSEARYRALLESAPDAIVIVDREGCIRLCNRRVQDLFGYSSDDLIGRSVEVLVPARFGAAHRAHRSGYVEHPLTRPMGAALELFALHRDGHEFPVEISLSPLPAGDDLLVTAAIRDISDRRRAEARLRELNRLQLDEIQHRATLGEVAAGLAHEIKNPLAGIAAALEVLTPHLANAPDASVMNDVQVQVKRIRNIVEDLLQYARPRPPQMVAGDFNATVSQVVHFAARQARPRGVAVNFTAEPLPLVNHDPEQIQRLVLNLVLNALDAVPDRTGRVDVATVAPDADTVCIQVRDNGAGIAPGQIEKIFRPFFTTKAGAGTGLGLPLCRRIAEMHQGALTVASTPGQGAVFTVTLPVAASAFLAEEKAI